jgi:hypothetical protein
MLHAAIVLYMYGACAYTKVCRDSMEYVDFLRGDDDAIPWDDVVPLTQEGLSGSQAPAPVVQSEDAPTEVAAAGGRGQSYSMKEDLLLVSTWLNVSMEPVVGSNQSLGAFWHRIESYFHDNKDFPSTRNKKSLQGRWAFINGMVQKFCGHYARAMRSRRSGTTEGETVRCCMLSSLLGYNYFCVHG